MNGKKKLSIILLAVTLLLAACAQTADESGFAPQAEEPFYRESLAEDKAEFEAAGAPSSVTNVSGDLAVKSLQIADIQERLIIREGHMDIVVADTEETLRAIAQFAGAKDGWVVDSQVWESGEAKSGSITIRVPAEEFEASVEAVRELANEVRSESTSSQDVTEEFVDLEARVANLEATADRVRGFLDETKTVEEALAVNAELSRLEGEIESLKARMKFLSQSAAFSRLTVLLTPDELNRPIEVGGWKPKGIALSAIESLISALQTVANVLIWAVIFCLPLIIIFGIPAYFLIRFVYRKWRRKEEMPAEEQFSQTETAGEAEPAGELDESDEAE